MMLIRCQSLRLPLACLGLGLLALAAGCSTHSSASSAPSTSPGQSPTVATVHPEQKALVRVIEQPAHVEALEETPLFARISGYVQKVHVDIGDRVKGPRFDDQGKQVEPGQALAELWVPEMDEELGQKKALVALAQAEVEQAVAAVAAAEANILSAKALILEAEAGRDRAQANYERWQSEHKRMEKMAKTVLDDQQLDEAIKQLKVADAARKEVEAKVGSAQAAAKESEAKRNKAQADLNAAKAKVLVAQAEAGRLSALLEYSRVRAPYEGVITSRTIHTGHYLMGTGVKPLFVIARTDTVRIIVNVPEAEVMYVREGVPARIRCQMIKGQEFTGTVTRSSWTLDAKARTLRTEIHLTNPKDILRPGMYAYVTFRAELPSSFTLPASAIITQGGETYCFGVEAGKAIRTPIQVGARDGQLVQVLKKRSAKGTEPPMWEEFTGKEEVILNPGSLADGQAVMMTRKP